MGEIVFWIDAAAAIAVAVKESPNWFLRARHSRRYLQRNYVLLDASAAVAAVVFD